MAKTIWKTRTELERIRELLRVYVDSSGIRPETLASGIGLEEADFLDIFREGQDFALYRLFQILGALGVAPRAFFGRLYGWLPPGDLKVDQGGLSHSDTTPVRT
jgi:hypothetical protein